MQDETSALNEPAAAPEPVQPAPVPELPPQERLRAFEQRVFGENVVYHEGKIDDGHGSFFQRLYAEHRAHHASLKLLADADAAHRAAAAAVRDAEEKLDAALEAAAKTDAASDALLAEDKIFDPARR